MVVDVGQREKSAWNGVYGKCYCACPNEMLIVVRRRMPHNGWRTGAAGFSNAAGC
jgi:hypothetical protein